MKFRLKKNKTTKPSVDFPVTERDVAIAGYRIHYIEAGQGDPVLFIHGNPTSSFVWRNVLPSIAHDMGRRGIALDLLGFGKSDKPDNVVYSIRLHADIVAAFIEKLGLRNIILVLHDWGGPLGAAYAVDAGNNIQGIVFMETFLWPLAWKDFGPLASAFRVLRSPLGYFLIQVLNLFVKKVLAGGILRKENITKELMRKYQEPFPTVGSRKAVRAFPKLLPVSGIPAESDAFIEELRINLRSLKAPVLWIKAAPGASKETEYHLHLLQNMLPQLNIKDFGPGLHFLQEENPGRIVDLIEEWMHQCGLAPTTTIKHAA